MTPYPCQLVTPADLIDAAAWQEACGTTRNPFLDVRFFRALEQSFRGLATFWYATLRDDSGRVIACAAFSRYVVDAADFAPPPAQKLIAAVRRLWPRFMKFHILLGGLPVSVSGCQLAMPEGIDAGRLCLTLDKIAEGLARQTRTKLIAFKEFAPEQAERLAALATRGYRRARSVVSYHLEGEFGSFEKYFESRSKRTRANIRRHFRRFEQAGLSWQYLRGREAVEALRDPAIHRLYLNVFERSQAKFERLPSTFFAELATQLENDACFTIVRQFDRIVGFCCGVASPGEHAMIYCGLDYEINPQSDLYFNIIYRGLAQGLVPGVQVVHVGATANEFKQHMGCRGVPLSIFVKAVGRMESLVFGSLFSTLFDAEMPPAPAET
ncbi:MAG: GNAT family N-acetyltransferase [Planctomycetaceae bacterium]